MKFLSTWFRVATITAILIGIASVILAVASFILDVAPTEILVVFFVAVTMLITYLVREATTLL